MQRRNFVLFGRVRTWQNLGFRGVWLAVGALSPIVFRLVSFAVGAEDDLENHKGRDNRQECRH